MEAPTLTSLTAASRRVYGAVRPTHAFEFHLMIYSAIIWVLNPGVRHAKHLPEPNRRSIGPSCHKNKTNTGLDHLVKVPRQFEGLAPGIRAPCAAKRHAARSYGEHGGSEL